MGQWSSRDLALQSLSGHTRGKVLAVFALNALGKSSLAISIPSPAFLPVFAALFHVGISSEACTDKEFKRKIGQWPCYLAKKG